MKNIALIMMGMSCALTGNYITHRLNMRVVLLEKLEIMLNTIVCEMNYLSTPVEDMISLLSNRKDLKKLYFLEKCNNYIMNGADFRTAWQRAVAEKSNVRYLNKSERALLEAFGNQFGTTDSEGQLSICSMYLDLLKDSLKEAKRVKEKYSSLLNGLGLLAGIGIVIIFF